MVRDGWFYFAGSVLGALLTGIGLESWPAAAAFVAVGLFTLYFFRDPERAIPEGAVCVSPADGKVVHIREQPDGRVRLSIFLSIFDVHVNRSPIAGVVQSVHYSRGRYLMAHRELASAENEQNALVIEGESGSVVELRQIAGLIARRIVCRLVPGDALEKGERFGLIKFGSRVDVVLGPEWELSVRHGDRVRGGSSVIASLR